MIDKNSNLTTAIVIGASGAIGHSLVVKLSETETIKQIYAFSRKQTTFDCDKVTSHFIDLDDELSIIKATKCIQEPHLIGKIFITTGLLHEDGLLPEKSLEQLKKQTLQRLFTINTIGPALIAKHFIPLLPRSTKAVIVALSARVGSTSDNRLGGWYGYRASKAALNMMIKTLSIELTWRCPHAVIVAMHPGTVDSKLSRPFQRNVRTDKLFSANQSAEYLLSVVATLTPAMSGKFFAWDGQVIDY